MTTAAATEAPITTIRNRKATTDITIGKNADGHEVVASIFSYHSKDNRALVSTLSRVTIEESTTPGFVIRTSFPMASVRIFTDPIARYSDKALESFHDDALKTVEALRKNVNADARVHDIFAPAK